MNTPKLSWSKDCYQEHDPIYIATDCIIFGFDEGILKLLVFKRRVAPQKGCETLVIAVFP